MLSFLPPPVIWIALYSAHTFSAYCTYYYVLFVSFNKQQQPPGQRQSLPHSHSSRRGAGTLQPSPLAGVVSVAQKNTQTQTRHLYEGMTCHGWWGQGSPNTDGGVLTISKAKRRPDVYCRGVARAHPDACLGSELSLSIRTSN